ncbi:hypothetical protein QR692_10360 [Lactococcus petauri]|uniref:hypothetical protein n=1 Tax=Lactococcus petauri TaxID=1940789 RepID=UPI0020788AD8|nr:hypothetical protein [Lactococcus petauri]USI65386.1 hypothetical protein LMK05_11245 [Lactococcus petauri]USI67881.1 hypothetical protein LMK04_10480 [Lactococcus petauri]WJE12542.1 hypothetical protein QR692_10360 [Lactococcus petauri]
MGEFQIIFGVAASLLSIIAFTPYVINTAKGKTKPHPITWLVSSIVGLITTLVMFSSGGGAMSLFWLTVFIPKPIIVYFAFKNGGQSEIKRKDIGRFVIAMLALVAWVFVKNTNLAATLLVMTSLFGISATIDKAKKKPYEEGLSMWSIQVFSAFLSILAIENFNYATVIKTLANLLINIVVVSVILVSRKKISKLRRINQVLCDTARDRNEK